jgi:hypothetical protein
MTDVPSIDELRDRALLWWPDEIRKEVATASFKDAMLVTFPIFQQTLKECTDLGSLIQKVKELNEEDKLPANLFLRHCMLFTDLGWEAVKKWYGEETYSEMFPDGKFKVGEIEFEMPKATNSKVRTKSKDIQESYSYELSSDQLEQIIACIKLLFMGSHSSLSQLERCNLSNYFDDEDGELFVADATMKYISVSKQTSGAEAAGSGDILEKNIAIEPINAYLSENFPELEYVSKTSHEFVAGHPLVSDQWFVNEENYRAVALEVSFQETTNSVIERKRKDAENRKNLFPDNCKSAFVIDGVGSIEHRQNAVREILSNADIVVTAHADEISRLAEYIGEWLS